MNEQLGVRIVFQRVLKAYRDQLGLLLAQPGAREGPRLAGARRDRGTAAARVGGPRHRPARPDLLADTFVGFFLLDLAVRVVLAPLSALAASVMYFELKRLHGEPVTYAACILRACACST